MAELALFEADAVHPAAALADRAERLVVRLLAESVPLAYRDAQSGWRHRRRAD